jgi:guanylate kinase
MAKATSEMSHWAEYDYVIINHKLAESVEQVGAILAAERLRRNRRVGLGEFIRDLGVSQ